MRQLTGHTTPETAFVIPRFPYCFGQYTSARYWIESKEAYGQRIWVQFWDPARGAWFKPKTEGYADLAFLMLQDDPHQLNYGLIEMERVSLERLPKHVILQQTEQYTLDEFQAHRVSIAISAIEIAERTKELQSHYE
jgi:hypothetical protein